MAQIFQNIKKEQYINTAKIFHENYTVKPSPIFGSLTLIHNTGSSNIPPANSQRILYILNLHPIAVTLLY
jgi:hypothetical protein